jgi:hypothetical protein
MLNEYRYGSLFWKNVNGDWRIAAFTVSAD